MEAKLLEVPAMTTRQALATVVAACSPDFDVRAEIIQEIEREICVLESRLRALRFQVGGFGAAVAATPATILINEVARKHQISPAEMLSKRRNRYLVRARWEAMWRMNKDLCWSLPQIGKVFDCDHSTVHHGVKEHQEIVDTILRAQSMGIAVGKN